MVINYFSIILNILFNIILSFQQKLEEITVQEKNLVEHTIFTVPFNYAILLCYFTVVKLFNTVVARQEKLVRVKNILKYSVVSFVSYY
jgi:hypothetical protein